MRVHSHARLSARLPGATEGAITDLILVMSGARSLIRFSCSVEDAEELVYGCRSLGVAAVRSPQAFTSARTAPNGFVLSSVPCEDHLENSRTFIFAGRDRSRAQEAADVAFDDERSGLILGYPPCCVEAFCRHRSHYLSRCDPIFALEGRGPWPFWSNTLMDMFGWHLLPHFPCHPECQSSRAIALGAWTALARYDADRALQTLLHLRQIVWRDGEGMIAACGADQGKERSRRGLTALDFTGHA